MTQIIAEENRIIRVNDDRWEILQHTNGELKSIIEAMPYGALRFYSEPANGEVLPPTRDVSAEDIEEVVLGWVEEANSWRLGVTLAEAVPPLQENRWIELAHWMSHNEKMVDGIVEAGESLSSMLGVSFRTIQSDTMTEKTNAVLPSPPLNLGIWRMEHAHTDEAYQFILSPSWTNRKRRRVVWYSFWTIVYFVVSIATFTSGIGLPNAGTLLPDPRVLPYLGLATGFVLIGIVLYTIYQIRMQPDRILIDLSSRTISAWRGTAQRWQIAQPGIESVYVSEIVQGKRRKDKVYKTYHGEINLRLKSDDFHYILDQGSELVHDNTQYPPPLIPENDRISLLSPHNASTDMQVAGLYVAQALGDIPCWYDVRLK